MDCEDVSLNSCCELWFGVRTSGASWWQSFVWCNISSFPQNNEVFTGELMWMAEILATSVGTLDGCCKPSSFGPQFGPVTIDGWRSMCPLPNFLAFVEKLWIFREYLHILFKINTGTYPRFSTLQWTSLSSKFQHYTVNESKFHISAVYSEWT